VLSLLLSPRETCAAQSPEAATERDYAVGRRLLDAAIRATGDSADLARIGELQTSFCARGVEIGQSARPDAPYDTIGAAGVRAYDLAGRRYAQTWSTEFRGGLPLALREIVTDSAAVSVDLRGGVVMAVVPGGISGSQRRVEDNAPYAPLAILQRARRNAVSIRGVRTDRPGGAANALVYADGGQLWTLRFDPRTHLLASMDALVDNWAVGLTPLEIRFSDYRRLQGVALATRVVTRFQHGLLTDVRFPDLRRASAPTDAFALPADLSHAVPIGGQLHVTIDSVAPHVFAIRNSQTAPPNYGYNPPFAYVQLLVELRDRLLLVDAPGPSALQQAVIEKVRALLPAKRIELLAFSHYHSDHFGGLRPYISAGATLLTTPGNRGLIERVAGVVHPSDATTERRVRRAPRIETFSGLRVLDDSEAPVELHEIGGAHADEMVVVYLPRQGVLFATDVFGILPARGQPGGTYRAERELAEYARRHGWSVRTVVAGHGPVSPGTALDSALTSSPAGARPAEVPACASEPSGARLGQTIR
jgi:glyoxylase-like metal-dependent hydrolase (beta-lactamase superfamily II)